MSTPASQDHASPIEVTPVTRSGSSRSTSTSEAAANSISNRSRQVTCQRVHHQFLCGHYEEENARCPGHSQHNFDPEFCSFFRETFADHLYLCSKCRTHNQEITSALGPQSSKSLDNPLSRTYLASSLLEHGRESNYSPSALSRPPLVRSWRAFHGREKHKRHQSYSIPYTMAPVILDQRLVPNQNYNPTFRNLNVASSRIRTFSDPMNPLSPINTHRGPLSPDIYNRTPNTQSSRDLPFLHSQHQLPPVDPFVSPSYRSATRTQTGQNTTTIQDTSQMSASAMHYPAMDSVGKSLDSKAISTTSRPLSGAAPVWVPSHLRGLEDVRPQDKVTVLGSAAEETRVRSTDPAVDQLGSSHVDTSQQLSDPPKTPTPAGKGKMKSYSDGNASGGQKKRQSRAELSDNWRVPHSS